ncbi:MAG: phosphate butyryltransferase, partial [bacterium]|nr:phosphate butyryltransferase [bacterium]
EPIVCEDAVEAVATVRTGRADVLIKGSLDTKAFMRAVLDRENGLRTGSLISHVAVLEVAGRLFIVTDSGICANPTLDEKVEILKNALPVAHRLGFECPKVAVLAMTETVNPKMPETLDADALSKMDIHGCMVQGPLALDLAVSKHAAEAKGVTGPVAGQADILLVPS